MGAVELGLLSSQKRAIGELSDDKLDAPSTAGTANQVLLSDGEGGQVWGDIGSGEITVDSTLSVQGSAADAKATGDFFGELSEVKEHTIVSDTYSGTRYQKVTKAFSAGKYHITIDSITSSDTDATTCMLSISNNGVDVWSAQFNRGVAIDIYINLPSQADAINLYASKSYAYAANDTYTFTNLKITKVYDLVSKVNGIEKNVMPINEYQIKTVKVLDSFTTNAKTYTFNNASTINNYSQYGTSSSYAVNTPPVKIRNYDGTLIYKNLRFVNSQSADVIATWTFDINGNFIRTVKFSDMLARETPFLSDEYYAILNEYPASYANSKWYVSSIDIEWLNKPNVYTVGSSGDFTTFTGMLSALANDDSEKTVYVSGGTYDIFTEMGGADYIASVSPSASELNWRDVCHVVPPNTTIIGMGNVVLSWQPTAEQMINEDTAFLFSPLNVSGNCHIENISVVAKNCRYVVHDETSGLEQYNGAKHYYKNCRFTLLSGTYGFIVYGAGHNKLMDVRFDDCIVESQNSSLIWSTHDWGTEVNNNSVFVFNNCIFTSTKSDPNVRFSSTDSVGRLDKVMFNNCYLQKVKFVTTSGEDAKQGYDVQLIGCSPVVVEYDDHVTDRVAVRQYNPIPQSE